MAVFAYKARDKAGQLTRGRMEAEVKFKVAEKLKLSGFTPISIEEQAKQGISFEKFNFFKKVSPVEVNTFTRLFWTLLKAGVPLVQSLKVIAEQAENLTLKECLIDIMHDVEKGESLTSATEKHPRVFNSLYTGMVRAGEASGSLSLMLERIAILSEKEEENRQMIKSATSYPILVISSMFIGGFALSAFVLPKFVTLFSQFKSKLPIPTRILLWAGQVVGHYWYLMIIVFIGVVIFVRFLLTIPLVKFNWHMRKLKLPIFGQLILKLNMAKFSRILSNLLTAGIPISQALDLTAQSMSNVYIRKTITQIKEKVIAGKSLHEPMDESRVFPSIVVQMVNVGEETGKMDDLLLNVADYYDFQSGYMIKNINTYIEPILLFILACGILVMALAIFLLMWNMVYLFKQN